MAKKILIVDDDPDDRKLMETILKKQGYNVTSVHNGKDAIKSATEKKFDLILLDLIMPGLDGYDVLKRIRDKVGKNIKIIFITIVSKVDVKKEGVDGFLQKPFTPETLIDNVKNALKNKMEVSI